MGLVFVLRARRPVDWVKARRYVDYPALLLRMRSAVRGAVRAQGDSSFICGRGEIRYIPGEMYRRCASTEAAKPVL